MLGWMHRCESDGTGWIKAQRRKPRYGLLRQTFVAAQIFTSHNVNDCRGRDRTLVIIETMSLCTLVATSFDAN